MAAQKKVYIVLDSWGTVTAYSSYKKAKVAFEREIAGYEGELSVLNGDMYFDGDNSLDSVKLYIRTIH